jgi:16S rRNA (guanine527-N7)-methyltransferase
LNKPTSKKKSTREGSPGWTELQSVAKRVGLDLQPEVLDQLEEFVTFLSEFNEHTNLVSNSDHEVILREHVIDSLTLVPLVAKYAAKDEVVKLVDIGSGAGFPAIVLALVLPHLHVTCVESIGKKTEFLHELTTSMLLTDRVAVLNDRAEILAFDKTRREAFDLATARAVGRLDLVGELTLPFLRTGGNLLAQKSTQQVKEELPTAQKPIAMLGGRVVETVALEKEITHRELSVVVIEKIRPTPERFPRPTAQLKRPIT